MLQKQNDFLCGKKNPKKPKKTPKPPQKTKTKKQKHQKKKQQQKENSDDRELSHLPRLTQLVHIATQTWTWVSWCAEGLSAGWYFLAFFILGYGSKEAFS